VLKVSAPKSRRHEKIEVPQEVQLRTTVELSELLRKLKSEVEKGNTKYYTPYSLAAAYSIKVSDAKRLLKEAVKQNILKPYSGGRRAPTFIPAHSKPS
jgi:small subunit ribosomal protein S25e